MKIIILFRRKPDLIDLHKYEHDCMRWKRQGIIPRPPPMIPGLLHGSFTEEENAIMCDNRIQADEIYEAYK